MNEHKMHNRTTPIHRTQIPGLRAFTLVESMVATIILTASFFAGLLVFNQVLTGDQIILRTQANSLMLEKWEETRMKGNREPGTWEANGLLIKKQVRIYRQMETVLHVTVTASIDEEEVGRVEGLMGNENEN